MALTKLSRLAFVCIGVLAVGWFVWNQHKQNERTRREEQLHAQEQARIELEVTQLATKWHARRDWDTHFDKDRKILGTIYTFELQQVLVSKEPLLFHAAVKDIKSENETVWVTFAKEAPIGLNIAFRLEATPNIVARISRQKPELLDQFAVIAEISSVGPLHETSGNDEERHFLASGICRDVLFVGSHGPVVDY